MTDTLTHADPALAAVDRLIAFWNAGTPEEQQRLAEQTFVDGVSWRVPVGHLRGVAALVDFRDRFAEHAPDYVFRARREPEAHHDRARLQWELVRADGRFAAGTDVLELDGDGRIRAMTGFLDEAPEGFDPHDHA